MKNITRIIFPILIAYFFIGCSQKIEFNKEYVERDLKVNLKKVKSEEVDILKKQNLYLKKHPNSFRAKATTLDINLTSVNENVLKEFFSQYFDNVSLSNEHTSNLYVDSQFYDYEYEYGFSDGNEVEVFVDVKVFYKNKKILDKKYSIKNEITALTLNLTIFPLVEENFHKTLLKLYETKLKPDLIKALNENIN